ncbi:hypothetical protein H2248_002821 [Termitomyces sp. 'cryptogamus']|nr:hypothetical protein H2248_002821 [Termitomyces sp. 'cryptogamus']
MFKQKISCTTDFPLYVVQQKIIGTTDDSQELTRQYKDKKKMRIQKSTCQKDLQRWSTYQYLAIFYKNCERRTKRLKRSGTRCVSASPLTRLQIVHFEDFGMGKEAFVSAHRKDIIRHRYGDNGKAIK